MLRSGVCGGGGGCCSVIIGPLGAPLAKASGDRDGTAPPGAEFVCVCVRGGSSPPLTPGISDLCRSELSPRTVRTWASHSSPSSLPRPPGRGLRGYLAQKLSGVETEAQRGEGLDQSL